MNIKVLGSGCSRCKKLEENVRKAVTELGLETEIEKVTDLEEIMGYGVMMTPALVIDEKVVASGKILTPSEIMVLINKGTTE